MPGSGYNDDEEKNRQPKTNVLEEGGERGERRKRGESEGVKAQVCRQREERLEKGKGREEKTSGGWCEDRQTGATDESRAFGSLTTKRGMGGGGAGKERGLPIQARSVKPSHSHHNDHHHRK